MCVNMGRGAISCLFMSLIIWQWNAHSIHANGIEFKEFLFSQEHRPHIICIQETWLKEELNFKIPGYNIFRKDREGIGGGVLIAVKEGITCDLDKEWDIFETISVKVKTNIGWIKVVNTYISQNEQFDLEKCVFFCFKIMIHLFVEILMLKVLCGAVIVKIQGGRFWKIASCKGTL